MTYDAARKEATRINGHVVCVHRMESYEYGVVTGPDSRAWPDCTPEETK